MHLLRWFHVTNTKVQLQKAEAASHHAWCAIVRVNQYQVAVTTVGITRGCWNTLQGSGGGDPLTHMHSLSLAAAKPCWTYFQNYGRRRSLRHLIGAACCRNITILKLMRTATGLNVISFNSVKRAYCFHSS